MVIKLDSKVAESGPHKEHGLSIFAIKNFEYILVFVRPVYGLVAMERIILFISTMKQIIHQQLWSGE